MFQSLCSALAGMLLVVMLGESGTNGRQMVFFELRHPDAPYPLYGPLQFQKVRVHLVRKNITGYSDGNLKFNFPFNGWLHSSCMVFN